MAGYPAEINFILGDGTEVGLALNMRGMAIFEQKKRKDEDLNEVYDATNKLVIGGINSILDYARGLYGCYLINLWNDNPRMILKDQSVMSLNDWYDRIGDDWETIYQTARFLSDPKFRAAFVDGLKA